MPTFRQPQSRTVDLSPITPRDLQRSATAPCAMELLDFLKTAPFSRIDRLLDVGCGYGGVTKVVADAFSASDLHGIDIDIEVESEAKSKGVNLHLLNAETKAFPFQAGYFDLVMSFGVFEHFTWFDNAMSEINRVLRLDAFFLFSMPNLGSWINRYALLLGYQPRDIEFSRKTTAGVHPNYPGSPLGHIHSATTRAIAQFMDYYGFTEIKMAGWRPKVDNSSRWFRIFDALLSGKPSLARRFFYLGKKMRNLSV